MFTVFAALLAGVATGKLGGVRAARQAGRLISVGLVVLLFLMGLRLGASESVVANLGQIGLYAFVLALGSVAGSVACAYAIRGFLPSFDAAGDVESGSGDSRTLTALVLGALVVGAAAGATILPAGSLSLVERATTLALAGLLFAVGVGLGADGALLAQVKRLGVSILALPASIAVGSVAGALAVGVALGMRTTAAAAVGAGFGWYSLSAVLITDAAGVHLGSLAFLANVFREVLALASLPLVVRHFGRAAGIAPGGATTMDVTLPAVKDSAGDGAVVPAFVNGAVLSSLVPVLVPAFLAF
ncbi:lysine exporter LysO family protein [Salarchaeum sp. JOR-1]|uniref:lysine exporter LysO family protein n=1 Tax=Salarchaeum sp. JOR-1 TaxID=2599399 RepID=UPI001198457D|nr:lysine exporter LysO family protein [Salarchaeum sp. JOR-1]QDX39682.1 lysine exporter LysO family protein [Salarchaeum sp. JOR-1]